MEFVKNTTVLICILSLIFAALSGIVSLEKYTFAIKTIISSIMILCIIKPIASENFSFEPLFENSSITDASIYDYDDAVINEAVRVQTKINLEKAACQILSDYEVRYKDLKFDVNIDASGCISISNVSLKSDSPLTAQYALQKIFGENFDIEVTEIE